MCVCECGGVCVSVGEMCVCEIFSSSEESALYVKKYHCER